LNSELGNSFIYITILKPCLTSIFCQRFSVVVVALTAFINVRNSEITSFIFFFPFFDLAEQAESLRIALVNAAMRARDKQLRDTRIAVILMVKGFGALDSMFKDLRYLLILIFTEG
jgi:hypothetical protein